MASVCIKTLSIFPQSNPRHTSAVISESRKGYSPPYSTVAGQAPCRGWAVPKLWRTRLHSRVDSLLLRSHLQLSGSSEAAPAGNEAVLHQGLLVHILPREKSQGGLLSPTLPGRGGIQLQTQHIHHTWEAGEASIRQCHVLLVSHAEHCSFCQFSNTWETHSEALNNVKIVVGSRGQRGGSALGKEPFHPASSADPLCPHLPEMLSGPSTCPSQKSCILTNDTQNTSGLWGWFPGNPRVSITVRDAALIPALDGSCHCCHWCQAAHREQFRVQAWTISTQKGGEGAGRRGWLSRMPQGTAPALGLCCSPDHRDKDRRTDWVRGVGRSWAVQDDFLQHQSVSICATDEDRKLNLHTQTQIHRSQGYAAHSLDMNAPDWGCRRGFLVMWTLTDCTTGCNLLIQPTQKASDCCGPCS